MATNNAYEQLLIELTNRARLDPVGEAERFGIDLNEGLPAGKIAPVPVAPLADSSAATQAARNHANWMLQNNVATHYEAAGTPGFTGVDPGARLVATGYGAATTF